ALLSEVIAKQLKSFNCLAQFAAVRAIHTAIRQTGESPRLIAGLARGYANLGTLTEIHWSPAHKVFKARALLYSERLVAKYPGPEASRARAYVRALVGLHQAALDDLATSQTKLPTKPTDKPVEESILVEAYCRGDSERLAKAGSGDDQKMLANYLRLLLADSSNLFEVRQRAAQSVLKLDGTCMRAVDSLINGAPLGIQRNASDAGISRFSKCVFPQVLEIADLSEEARKLAKPVPNASREIADRIALIKHLEKAGTQGDSAEPSLAVAGMLIRETGFVHAWRWLAVRRHTLDWNVDGPLAAMRPVVEGHPYAAFIETHVWDRDAAVKPLKTIAELTRDPNLEATEEPMIAYLGQYSVEAALALRLVALQHSDPIFRDLIDVTRHSNKEPELQRAAQRLREISPYAPATIVASILHDWEYAAPRAQEWEQKYARDPDVLESLGTRFLVLQKIDDAERCLKHRVEALADQDGFKQLANFYRHKGDEAAWVKTLEKSLTAPSYGLEKAGTQVELAEHFTSKGDLKAAAEHADLAADSHA
ncbi:MAG TPA: hypothetical protein VGZ26_13060, partial [Pirellulales bacterium]|nr:hypothetical protein [Pirellulales bacterium]